jgi:hypothetical protein
MPNIINNTNNAVATLMYQVGVSIDMDYSPQSSGAYVIQNSPTPQACAEYSLKNYFGYKNTLKGVERKDYSTTEWINLLKTELNSSRPILYAGFGSGGGHCFVADGYDNNNFIHFNWGWGGQYDSFFQIDALNPDGTGTGGGSGSYNSDHQAVIGIEPPTGSQTFDLSLYKNVTPSASSIDYGNAFSVSTNIVNSGGNKFTGDFTAAIFDASYNFVDYLQTLSGYNLQGGGYFYTNDLTFATNGMFNLLPGTYYIGMFYRATDGGWKLVANNGVHTNFVQIQVVNSNDIELNSEITVSPSGTLTQGQPVTINLNIVNDGTTTFKGSYSVDLYNLDGSWAQEIGTKDEKDGLPSNYTYQSPFLTFSTNSITVKPGSYLLAVQHNPNNTGWKLTGSSYHLNPIKVIVKAADLLPDIYEMNNSENQAYIMPLIFSNNNAVINTTGSNCHITSDNDFYKVVLPIGYKYTITPRIHDSYNSSNGNSYTLDGVFSYSLDGVLWSDVFDDVMVGNIIVNSGGTVYFRVAPYFSGDIGTYLLSMSIDRVSTLGIEELIVSENINIYPNPARDFIIIEANDINSQIEQVNILSVQGQIVSSIINVDGMKMLNIPFQNIAEGTYLLQIQTNSGFVKKQLVVTK